MKANNKNIYLVVTGILLILLYNMGSSILIVGSNFLMFKIHAAQFAYVFYSLSYIVTAFILYKLLKNLLLENEIISKGKLKALILVYIVSFILHFTLNKVYNSQIANLIEYNDLELMLTADKIMEITFGLLLFSIMTIYVFIKGQSQ